MGRARNVSRVNREEDRIFRAFMTIAVLFSLGLSVFFSLGSFTGYIISEEIDVVSNYMALGLFALGILGAWYLFRAREK